MLVPKKISNNFSISINPPQIVYVNEIYHTSIEILQNIVSSFSIKEGIISVSAILAEDENGLFHLIQEKKKMAGESKTSASSNFKFKSGDVVFINAFQFYKKITEGGIEKNISTTEFCNKVVKAIYMGKIERTKFARLKYTPRGFSTDWKEKFDVFYIPELDLISTSPSIVLINDNPVIDRDFTYINSEKDFLKTKMMLNNDNFSEELNFVLDNRISYLTVLLFNAVCVQLNSNNIIIKNGKRILEEIKI